MLASMSRSVDPSGPDASPAPAGVDAQFLLAIASVRSLSALGAAMRQHALRRWGAAEANLVQALRRESGAWIWETEPPRQLDDEEVELIERALRSRTPVRARIEAGTTLVQPLVDTSVGWSGWLIRSPSPGMQRGLRRPGWSRALAAVCARLQALQAVPLRRPTAVVDEVEHLQRTLFGIADLANSRLDLGKVLADTHRLLGELMDAEGLQVALLDEDRSSFRFLYYADPVDPAPPPVATLLRMDDYPHSITVGLLRQCRSLQGSTIQVAKDLGIDPACMPGPNAQDWLGVPILAADGVRGAILVQSRNPERSFGESERDLLAFVAQLIHSALERRLSEQRLERQVEERTEALRAEIAERERAVRLQRALYRIAELSSSTIGLDAFYTAVHGVVGELLTARNFLIALLQEDGSGLHFPYQVDETGDVYPHRPLRRGLSEYVLRVQRPVLIGAAEVDALVSGGEVERIGTPAVCWLGVPLRAGERTVGLIIVQSYTEGVSYSVEDQELLSFVSLHIGSGLARKQAQDSLRRSNAELGEALQRLRETQRELVSAEKMAALGQLVAGVAHEVNTPLGIAITAASGLAQEGRGLRRSLESGDLQRSGLERHLGYADEATSMIVRNLQRAAELIRTFKQVAVDRSADGRRRFDLGGFIRELLPSLGLLWKHRPVAFELDCVESIEVEGFPGALGQIITNLVQNALVHAFPEGRSGRMRLTIEAEGDERIRIVFEDDGVGIASDHLRHVFEPFFTTRRGQGGTGLGLHIAFNLVTEKLGGSLRAESGPGEGARFIIDLPRIAPG